MIRRSTRPPARTVFLALLFAILAAACSSTVPPTPTPSPSLPAEPSLTPVPGGSTAPTPPPAGQPPTQTDTEWGRIWDGLPPSFPVPADAVPTETREGPVSATLAVGASAERAAELVEAALKEAGYSINANADPSEDGSVVIDAIGAAPGCLVQVRLTPLSGTTSMVVLYGAGCPWE